MKFDYFVFGLILLCSDSIYGQIETIKEESVTDQGWLFQYMMFSSSDKITSVFLYHIHESTPILTIVDIPIEYLYYIS
ncbi:unnamed protein product [Schistosoma mattheei]|uniref:Uncharacterized protein n=1 Tax=Schistosoma mattheei TaxID=31246 RepID=A0AA85BCW1_9TREM|nr:unnamed protein product [Schistosoma mattheei]